MSQSSIVEQVDRALDSTAQGTLSERLSQVAADRHMTVGQLLALYYKLTGIQIILSTGEKQ